MLAVQARVRLGIGLAVGLLGLLAMFQNCSRANFGSSNQFSVSGDGASSVANTLTFYRPALAVRSANCINCHGNTLNSSLITDFGFGDSYFFATDHSSPVGGDYVYGLRTDANSATNTYVPNWAQAQQYGSASQIIVPRANLGFTYKASAPSWAPDQPWLDATTLLGLMKAIATVPGAESTPVVEVSSVYIGVPMPSQLRAAGGLGPNQTQAFFRNEGNSPALSGLTNTGSLWTNTGVVICDGDVFIDGTVFLNALSLQTQSGCRIHATGPIFMQKALTYINQTAQSNLQLLSSRLVSLGVGNTHCESASNPGWYNSSNYASPSQLRFGSFGDPNDSNYKGMQTRNSNPTSTGEKTSASSAAEGQALYAAAQAIPALEDASCHGRAVDFDHLLLVAPQVHSRYTGALTGMVIAEFPLLSLGKLTFTFDDLFNRVKVFPMIPGEQILVVKPKALRPRTSTSLRASSCRGPSIGVELPG